MSSCSRSSLLPFLRLQARVPLIILVCATVFALTAIWPLSQRARTTRRARISRSSSLALPDKGVITPAATIAVNSLSDVANGGDGLCTLREAIGAANNNAASGATAGECLAGSSSVSDTITFSVNGTINLTSALPDITSNMSLSGPGPGQLTVRRDTGGQYRIFLITSGATVTMSGLTVANGAAFGSFPGNSGGGIWNNHSTLTLLNTVVTGNTANATGPAGFGGGIYNDSSNFGNATLTIINSTLSSNACTGSGGAIYNNGFRGNAAVTITNSTISNNQCESGGGIYSTGQTGNAPVRITNSAIIGNNARDAGGVSTEGVNGGNASLIITNTTISGNTVLQFAGGVRTNTSLTSLTNCTVTNNRAGTNISSTNPGGGIEVFLGTAFLRNTIVAGNFRGASGLQNDNVAGGLSTSSSFNIIGPDISAGLTNGVNGNQTGVSNPGLAPLAANGGATLTHALLSTSPALDAGDNCVTQPTHCGDPNIPQLTTDQRGNGFNRILDGPDVDTTATVDIGAFEPQGTLASVTDITSNEDTQVVVPFELGDTSTVTSITATSTNTTLVPNDPANISTGISGSTGVVTINPVANLFGTTNITITINRTGGNESKTFLLTVNSVNDVPSFIKGPDQTVLEDAGAQSVANWATSVSPGGPADESTQNLTFQITDNTNTSLFSAGPAISAAGTLTYTPAANANGSATITINLKDDGGTANGGIDTSATQTFLITVTQVNDPPSFTRGADQTVNNNAGAQVVNNWATNISRGPADESSQNVNFQVTSNSNPGLFANVPGITPTGTLVYTPLSNAGGTATIKVNLKDTGGTTNGGVDTSAEQTFNITINPAGGFISFSAANYDTTESSGFAAVTVKRTGNLTQAATVDYVSSADNGLPCATPNGVATPKCDFTTALGTLSFAAGEDTKTVNILISQDAFVEGPETFTLTLSNQTGNSALGPTSTATTTIADDVTEPATNPVDDTRNFVRQHYHDFLNREPDQGGWDFWTNQITSCGSDAGCNEVRRIDVSASFFLSIEFQQSGYLVERFYKVAYGSGIGNSTFNGPHSLSVPIVRFSEFLKDTQRIGRGVVVLQPGWEQALENNKQAYATEFVQTTRFIGAYPPTMSTSSFVDQLNLRAGAVLSTSERQTVINLFGGATNSGNVTARAQAVRMVADDIDLYNAEFNRAFVLAEYFGYLRRNPNDSPDTDYTGYDFWLTKLNQFNGNYINAEMVKAFLSSIEYRQRFGP